MLTRNTAGGYAMTRAAAEAKWDEWVRKDSGRCARTRGRTSVVSAGPPPLTRARRSTRGRLRRLGDKKKKRTEINRDYYAGAKEAKEKKKAIIRRWCSSFRQRYLRLVLPLWQKNARIRCAPPETILMKLDGLSIPNRMPP